MTDALSLAQPYAERLAEDESLRGALTDGGFGPTLDWATNQLIALAGQVALTTDGAAVDARLSTATDTLREIIGAVVQAAESGQIAELTSTLSRRRFDAMAATDDQAPLADVSLSDDPDANALALIAALPQLRWGPDPATDTPSDINTTATDPATATPNPPAAPLPPYAEPDVAFAGVPSNIGSDSTTAETAPARSAQVTLDRLTTRSAMPEPDPATRQTTPAEPPPSTTPPPTSRIPTLRQSKSRRRRRS